MIFNINSTRGHTGSLLVIPTLAARSSQKAKRLQTAAFRVNIVEELGVKR